MIGFYFFFFNDTATTEIYTLSLHDALPIWPATPPPDFDMATALASIRKFAALRPARLMFRDRKSTRLNSSHSQISYAVFCLKKKQNDPHQLSLIDQPKSRTRTDTKRLHLIN